VIIGGLGTIWGAMWGTLAIVILPEILKQVNEDLTNLVFGVLLIAIMIFSGNGSSGLRRRLAGKWPRRPDGEVVPPESKE
jgi:ABC-type branched-subunit amino acid transport system permease subunit